MSNLFFCFKTAVKPGLDFKMGAEAYIAATHVTCFAYAIDDEDPAVVGRLSANSNFGTELPGRDHIAIAHNLDFHGKVWKKLGFPAPKSWVCTMQNWKEILPKTKFGMDKIAEALQLPPRIKVDELALNGEYSDELGQAAMRDVMIVRAIYRHLAKQPRAAKYKEGAENE